MAGEARRCRVECATPEYAVLRVYGVFGYASALNGANLMATVTATTRLPDWLERELRTFWETHGEGPSIGLRRVVEEW